VAGAGDRGVKHIVTVSRVEGDMVDISTPSVWQAVMGYVAVTATNGPVTVEWRAAEDWPRVGDTFDVEITPHV
jgi:hypothetical protein